MIVAEFSYLLCKILYMVLKAKVTDTDLEIVQDPEKDIIILEHVEDLIVEKENIEITENEEITITENVVEAAKEITEEKTNITMIDTNTVKNIEVNDLQEMNIWSADHHGAIRDRNTRIAIANVQGINRENRWKILTKLIDYITKSFIIHYLWIKLLKYLL